LLERGLYRLAVQTLRGSLRGLHQQHVELGRHLAGGRELLLRAGRAGVALYLRRSGFLLLHGVHASKEVVERNVVYVRVYVLQRHDGLVVGCCSFCST